jgi:hypothetical protein
MTIATLERLEGLVLGALALMATWYFFSNYGWLIYVVLILLPDVSMIGYLRDPRLGAILYNLGHTFSLPLILAVYGFYVQSPAAVLVALLWIAHIGIDRALGFGLKLPSGFKDTHLGTLR